MPSTKIKRSKENVVVLQTSIGSDLVIRSNPSNADVRKAVKIQTDRYLKGEHGGPAKDHPAHRIFNARRYASEYEYILGSEPTDEIDLADLLPTVTP